MMKLKQEEILLIKKDHLQHMVKINLILNFKILNLLNYLKKLNKISIKWNNHFLKVILNLHLMKVKLIYKILNNNYY